MMPIVSVSQYHLCRLREYQAKLLGKNPTWNCRAEFQGDINDLPFKVSELPQVEPDERNVQYKIPGIMHDGHEMFVGPRGGYYFWRGDKKVYIRKTNENIQYVTYEKKNKKKKMIKQD